MYEFIAEQGYAVLSWVLAIVGTLLTRYVWRRIGNDYARGVVSRAYEEVRSAVLEVAQTYTSELKAGRADGRLTESEKTEAKQRAIARAKSNIGRKGLERLARVLDLESVEGWLANRTEAAVAQYKHPELVLGNPQ